MKRLETKIALAELERDLKSGDGYKGHPGQRVLEELASINARHIREIAAVRYSCYGY